MPRLRLRELDWPGRKQQFALHSLSLNPPEMFGVGRNVSAQEVPHLPFKLTCRGSPARYWTYKNRIRFGALRLVRTRTGNLFTSDFQSSYSSNQIDLEVWLVSWVNAGEQTSELSSDTSECQKSPEGGFGQFDDGGFICPGVLFCSRLRAGRRLTCGSKERGVERGRQRIRFPAIRDFRDQKLITESLRMTSASE